MMRRPLCRPLRLRVLALAAAYAVALQGLLAAFAIPAVALSSDVLCSGQVIGDSSKQTKHGTSCVFACAVLAADTPQPPAAVVFRHEVQSAEPIAPCPACLVAVSRGQQTARAPPSV